MEELQSVLDLLTVTLRNQDIKLDDDNKSTVIKRIQKYKDIYPDVLVKQVRDILHLIGPSSGSYDMKQRLLGKTTEALPAGRTGRSTIPNSRDRRSSSVPRQTRRREDAPSACDPVISPATLQYPPSSYQNAPGCGRAGHTGEPTPPASSSRSRSSSESRSKAIDRKEKLKQEGGALEQRAAHRQDDVTNFPDGQKSKLSKMQLSFMKMTKTDIKNKFSRKPKIL
ncbi:hypothetical protein DPEC_G00288650 [Dallia pectoralis]|uniref:Uncharacterized protein n=1 Tax=Dallia pectoralis TaxID=75939 RepID=A0ACC2FKK5_DALPE|nr:hypothetical protein DPEC_G00288650 [Dallia pectoralis]